MLKVKQILKADDQVNTVKFICRNFI